MKLGPYLYHLNTFNIPNNEDVNEWVGRSGNKETLENAMKLRESRKFCSILKLILDPPLSMT